MDNVHNQRILNLLLVRAHTIILSDKQLMSRYDDFDRYKIFIYNIEGEIITDALYLFEPKYVDKILNMISENRFKYNDSDLTDSENNIIIGINKLRTMSKDQIKNRKYESFILEKLSRGMSAFDNLTDEDMIYCMSADYQNFNAFLNGNLCDDKNFFATLTYITALRYVHENTPELFNQINELYEQLKNSNNLHYSNKAMIKRGLKRMRE